VDIQLQKDFNRLRLFYFIYFSSVGCFWPYITLFFKKLNFTGQQIGLLTAIGPLVMLLAQPVWGVINDKAKSGSRILRVVCLCAILVCLSFMIPKGFMFFFILMGLFSFLSYSIIPLADTITIYRLRGTDINYGQVRAWGSFGFCVLAVIVGQLGDLSVLGNLYRWLHPGLSPEISLSLKGIPFLFLAYALMMGWVFYLTYQLPVVPKSSRAGKDFSKLFELIKDKRFVYFLTGVFLLQMSLNTNVSFFSLYLDHLKGSTGLLGWCMTLAALGEIPVFLYATKIFSRFKPLHLLVIAALTGALRWYLYTVVSNPYIVLLLQPMHAINFGCYYLGAVHFVDEESPREWKTTGQTIFWAVGYGLSAITGNLVGGFIFQHYGIIRMYQFGSVIAMGAALTFFTLDSIFPRQNKIS